MMLMDPVLLIILVIAVLAVVMLGPSKIPELARALGRAKKEYQNASAEIENGINEMAQEPQKVMTATATPRASNNMKLIDVAKKLGISTEGKTSDQIAQEIVDVSKA